MAQFFQLHPEHPQPRLIKQAAEILRSGGLFAVPTDAAYSLVGVTGHAPLLERIRAIRGVDEKHHFTLMCRDLSEIAKYARVDNAQFRLLKATTPGSYTFILEGTRELPRRLLHPKRKTIGLRVPDHPVVLALLAALDEPLLSSTLILPGDELPLADADEIRERLEKQLDAVIDTGHCGIEMTTVVNLIGDQPELVRAGRGALAPCGLD
ncbi:MAG TPA: L-threonylcarbamoyladenylate synthase [Rugosibacter sp.]|nr:L-threonylcarbamoyladenylate synthase [Rugosibacter sp.]HQN45438.1 L-threonylcarbamoyladenylate synthase [Rugosibacter sp.]HQQ35044.1 L-threonylcarbamoyladenylate synthase [Rugosibacter sp.]